MSSYDNKPAQCAKGCGFYGSPANRNLCSKCYQVFEEELGLCESYTKTIASSLPKLSIRKENDHVPDDDSVAVNKPSCCVCCKKKIWLLGFICKCGDKFCDMHRFPENHTCLFDYKTLGSVILARENPLVNHDKLGQRI